MKYYVEILWGSVKGNPCATRSVVEADSQQEALQFLSERIRKYKRFAKLHGGYASQYDPYPYGVASQSYYSFVSDELVND